MAYDDSQDLILSPLSLDISLSDTVPQEFSKMILVYLFTILQNIFWGCHTESVRISSPHGQLEVIREGITSCHAPAIITFHDLGLNHITNYKVINCQIVYILKLNFYCLEIVWKSEYGPSSVSFHYLPCQCSWSGTRSCPNDGWSDVSKHWGVVRVCGVHLSSLWVLREDFKKCDQLINFLQDCFLCWYWIRTWIKCLNQTWKTET